MPKKSKKDAEDAEAASNPFAQVMAKPEEVLELVSIRKKLEDALKKQQDLADENKQLKEKLSEQKFEQSEIFSYLNKELVQKSRSVAMLEARVQELNLDVSANQQDYEQKLVEEKAMAREMTAKLAREVGRYEKELGDLNVFISKKNELEKELEETRAELLQERRKHEQIIGELERKTVQEKERLRREMEHKIQEAKEAFMRLTDDQLEATTKRTMRENEQMAAELAYQSRETERLLLRNAKLVEENRAVRRELALHRQTEAEMARRNHAYLRTIRGLLAKLKGLDARRRELERQGRDREESEVAQYKQRVALLQETVEDAFHQLDEVRVALEAKTVEAGRLSRLQDEVCGLLLGAADDVRRRLEREQPGGAWIEESAVLELGGGDDGWRPGDALPAARLDELPPAQQERVLRYLWTRLSELQLDLPGPRSPRGPGAAAAAAARGLPGPPSATPRNAAAAAAVGGGGRDSVRGGSLPPIRRGAAGVARSEILPEKAPAGRDAAAAARGGADARTEYGSERAR